MLTVTENGYGKRTHATEFKTHGRGTQGQIAMSTSERNGRLVSAILATEDDEIMLLSTGGKVIRTRASEVSVYSRHAQGVKLINLGEDTVASVRRVAVQDSEEEIEHLQVEGADEADVGTAEDPVDLTDAADDAAETAADEMPKAE